MRHPVSERCPKCGSKHIALIEHYEHSITWFVVSGGIDVNDGHKAEGPITGVSGKCLKKGCGHWWQTDAPQIHDLITK